jgi:hypothetical protein
MSGQPILYKLQQCKLLLKVQHLLRVIRQLLLD